MTKTKQNNLMPKIFAILFAFIIWLYVMSEINPRITSNPIDVPIEFLNEEEMRQAGLVIKGEADHSIKVRLSGRRDEVQKISKGQIKATADLLGFKAGIHNIPVEVSVSGDVEVDYPRYVRVELEEIVSKQKPVNVAIEGTPRKGFTLGEIQYEPTVVWIEGAESLVNSVEVVKATIKLSEEAQNIVTLLPLKPLNSRGEEVPNIKLQTPNVNIVLPVDQLKTIDIHPIVKVDPADGYEVNSITVEPKTVTIRGQQEIIGEINSIDTESVTIEGVSESIKQKISLILPEGVIAVDATEVDLIITVEPLVEKSFNISRDDITFMNLTTGLKIDKKEIPEVIQVKIVASETIMRGVKADDINIVIDMEGLEENQYAIEPVVEVPFLVERRAKSIELLPKTVNVKVVSQNNE